MKLVVDNFDPIRFSDEKRAAVGRCFINKIRSLPKSNAIRPDVDILLTDLEYWPQVN